VAEAAVEVAEAVVAEAAEATVNKLRNKRRNYLQNILVRIYLKMRHHRWCLLLRLQLLPPSTARIVFLHP
jgi:hypothetical protein